MSCEARHILIIELFYSVVTRHYKITKQLNFVARDKIKLLRLFYVVAKQQHKITKH